MPAPLLTAALMFACRYPSDDINKFLWMVRIGGGVFPDIKEADYLGPRGYTIDDSAGKVSSRLCLSPGWDWDGEVLTSSLLQHGPGGNACTEEVLQVNHWRGALAVSLLGQAPLQKHVSRLGRHGLPATCLLSCVPQSDHGNCGWPDSLLQQQDSCTMSCGHL